MSPQPLFCFVAEANRIRISKQLRTHPQKHVSLGGKGTKHWNKNGPQCNKTSRDPGKRAKKKQLKTHNEHEGGEPFCWP